MTRKLKVLELFAGIGGVSCGLDKTQGYQTVAVCEINPFCRDVLKRHWPEAYQYDDVRTLTARQLAADGIAVDVVTGGFPCQDISSAGAQAGIGEGTRSGLYRHVIRIVDEVRPSFVIFENVARLLSGPKEAPGQWFWQFLNDLAEVGYDAEWHCITAASVGAPHERDRIWIIAYPNEAQLERGSISGRIYAQHAKFGDACWGQDKPGVVRTLNGVPDWSHRVGALGNAVVPQISEIIGNAILESLA